MTALKCHAHLAKTDHSDRSFIQAASQSTNQLLLNKPVNNQSATQPSNQLISYSSSQSTNKLLNQPINQSATGPANQSVSLSFEKPFGHSDSEPNDIQRLSIASFVCLFISEIFSGILEPNLRES